MVGPVEFFLKRKDGTRIPVEIRVRPLEIEGQTLILGSVRDVGERKEAEEALEESEEKYRGLFEEARDVIFVISRNGRLEDVNPAGVRLFGWSREEILPLENIHQDPADRQAFLEQLFRDGSVDNYELALKNKSGEPLAVLATCIVAHDEDGNPTGGYRGTLRDITEQRQLEVQLRQVQKMEAVGLLAGGIAHDFNNLLTSIGGFTELALDGLPDDSPIAEDLETALRESARAADLTQQLLAFSRRQPLDRKVLNLNALIENTTKTLVPLIGEHIDVDFSTSPDLGNVSADAGQIDQILMNLAINARDAMSDGGKLTIETRNVTLDEDYCRRHTGAKPGRYVMLAVADTGCGMDEATQRQVFEPFFTTKEVGKGTGLGLASVYGIVKQHEGYIEAYSELGLGTNFKVYFPRLEEDREEEEEIGATEEAISLNKGQETVLVVEDDGAVLEITRRALESRGYKALVAGSPSEAEGLLEKHGNAIDLLLTDVVLPEMNGPSLHRKLCETNPELQVLVMSGYPARAALRDFGSMPYISKPFTADQLAEKVRETLLNR